MFTANKIFLLSISVSLWFYYIPLANVLVSVLFQGLKPFSPNPIDLVPPPHSCWSMFSSQKSNRQQTPSCVGLNQCMLKVLGNHMSRCRNLSVVESWINWVCRCGWGERQPEDSFMESLCPYSPPGILSSAPYLFLILTGVPQSVWNDAHLFTLSHLCQTSLISPLSCPSLPEPPACLPTPSSQSLRDFNDYRESYVEFR